MQTHTNHATKYLAKLLTALALTSVLAGVGCASITQDSSSSSQANSNQNNANNTSQVDMSQVSTYEIDPTHTNVRFAIDHFNTSTNTGGFYNLTGEVKYDPKQQFGKVAITIPMTDLNTGNEKFDEHLKSEDFFAVEQYPTALFESTQWHFAKADDGSNDGQAKVTQVDGNLTMHGKTHPVSLTATKFNCYFSPVYKKSVCGGDFTTTIDRTNWGIDKYVAMGMSKQVRLTIQVEAIKQ
ncbi:YceI family protein [Psychrobacter sp. I-STPA10]|uniref:YceI family protein n=1 Tax=Psychrobacter sp. I-STPA10 TaxID=2585769 RepID=UPI001E5B6B22|nr:YceI family protein [Psychrobacter sp. I-STPA10]